MTLNTHFPDNPIVYHLITDRFCDGSRPDMPVSAGATADEALAGTFHGGNFAGITHRIRTGWFNALGVNAILMSAPYEQIRGWVPGGDVHGQGGGFRHYAYHGYYALDYTVPEPRFGTEQDIRELVAAAHARGIRVILDVAMNHPGYPDLQTLSEFGIDVLSPGWEGATPANYDQFLDRQHPRFHDWWGAAWVRGDYAGYPPGGDDDLTMLLFGLPDFRTESRECVSLPRFLKHKRHTRAIDLPGTTVRGYLIRWLTDWVRRCGFDGFRCDSAKHVELDAWLELKRAAQSALAEWKAANADGIVDDAPFWMVGEAFGHGVSRSAYFDFGFDSLINFQFQDHVVRVPSLDSLYRAYAKKLGRSSGMDVLSYVSSHDTCLWDRSRLIEAGTALLLAPGGVMIMYGDETARPPGPFIEGDPAQATRSDMNWDAIDQQVLAHWSKLGKFRARHVAIARGMHSRVRESPYVFARHDVHTGDRILAALDCWGESQLPVGELFLEGEAVHDAYSGRVALVRNGHVELRAEGVVLLERAADRI